MAESATLGTPAVLTEPEVAPAWPIGVIWRDIARGGLAGLVVGLVIGGLGGRVAMRLIALLIPESTGRFTENGNQIGDITFGGSLGLILFGGLFAGIFVGTLWVVITPWLPRRLGLRVLAAIPLAIGLGTFVVVQGSNSDFLVLGYDPSVIVVLLGLVALGGAAMAVVDAWLDRHLPRARAVTSPESGFYFAITLIGSIVAVLVAVGFLAGPLRPAGIALLVSGVCTLRWWYLRYRGAERPPQMLRLLGSGSVIAAVVLGFLIELPHIRLALGIF